MTRWTPPDERTAKILALLAGPPEHQAQGAELALSMAGLSAEVQGLAVGVGRASRALRDPACGAFTARELRLNLSRYRDRARVRLDGPAVWVFASRADRVDHAVSVAERFSPHHIASPLARAERGVFGEDYRPVVVNLRGRPLLVGYRQRVARYSGEALTALGAGRVPNDLRDDLRSRFALHTDLQGNPVALP